jgi:hypothetical protein
MEQDSPLTGFSPAAVAPKKMQLIPNRLPVNLPISAGAVKEEKARRFHHRIVLGIILIKSLK